MEFASLAHYFEKLEKTSSRLALIAILSELFRSIERPEEIEQVCYLLEGEAHVEVGGEKFEMKPGEACFFPAETMHLFIATSPRVKVVVIYAPPYGENPEKVIRPR